MTTDQKRWVMNQNQKRWVITHFYQLMGHDSYIDDFNGSQRIPKQKRWVTPHFRIKKKCPPTPSVALFMTTP
jgi:hypothetical protein